MGAGQPRLAPADFAERGYMSPRSLWFLIREAFTNIWRHQLMTLASITTVAALMLYDEGKLKLDDPVSRYLPEFSGLRVHTEKGEVNAAGQVTIRDLMRHTSGLTYGVFGDSPVDKLYREHKVLNPGDNLAELVAKLPAGPRACSSWEEHERLLSEERDAWDR